MGRGWSVSKHEATVGKPAIELSLSIASLAPRTSPKISPPPTLELLKELLVKLEEKEREVWLSEQKKEEECKNRIESKPPGAEITEEEGIEEG